MTYVAYDNEKSNPEPPTTPGGQVPPSGDDPNDGTKARPRQSSHNGTSSASGNGQTKAKGKRLPPIPLGAPLWYPGLILGRDGPRDCIANVSMVLRLDHVFVGRIAYDEMRERVVVGSLPWHKASKRRDWTDLDDIALAEWCQLRELAVKPTTVAQAVQRVAGEYKFNPLRDRLDGLQWDGVKRLDTWLAVYLGVADTGYSRAVGRSWLISGAARVYQPGCQADHVLILEGPQGAGKSRACRVLALDPQWFTDEIADLGTKDSAQDLPGKWIVELGELAAMRRGDVERVKAFLSRTFDHYRPSYGRRSQDFPRQCIFVGSTNAEEYLADDTGGRRFWSVKCGQIDLNALRRDVERLWAEAVAAFKAGSVWWLDVVAEVAASAEQDSRLQVDPWEETVMAAAVAIHSGQPIKVEDRDGYKGVRERASTKVTTNAILDELAVPTERREKRHSTRIGIILRRAGWTVREDRLAVPPEPRRRYVPPGGWED